MALIITVGPAACISCKEPNEYQTRPFTCGKCRHEARLRSA